MSFLGIDPGTRNVGLARLDIYGKWTTKALIVPKKEHPIVGIARFIHEVSGVISAVGVEDYAFFGVRKNYGPMKEVIGAIRGFCYALGSDFYLFQPKEKERVSHRLARPKGQTDHEFDARCLAELARVEDAIHRKKGTKESR